MQLEKIPPDGGYGWIIVFAYALTTFIAVTPIQCFGLIFKDTFSDMALSATEGSLVINVNAAFGKILGPLIGILLKTCGFRKTAILGGVLLTAGMVLTSFSSSFTDLILFYGFVTSLGMQMSESAQRLALNAYFKERRSVAMGFGVTMSGFGPILVPQLIQFLANDYTPQEVTLIYGGICAHVLIGAALLQPVEWHLKTVPREQEQNRLLGTKVIDDRIRDGICHKLFNNFDLDLLKDPVFVNILIGLSLATFAELNFTLLVPFILQDFGLGTDQIAIFLSTLGIADIIFRFLGPYLGSYFTKPSRVMFSYAVIILIFIRFSEYLRFLLMSVWVKAVLGLLLTRNFSVLLIIALALGLAKGVRKVYIYLVIPDYVPMEKLPSAVGMETLFNGLCMLIGGPILGVLRDVTGSYAVCIVVMNCVTISTIVLWLIEVFIVKYVKKGCD
nr:PREDICTED: monocarboxylate transporter 13 isoform X1 [Tribolium castaneum]|eukprot:XP_015834493.1 PREDICTED: monocarboxylate transporter 13 isoform X1 [Tribolium castaneum]